MREALGHVSAGLAETGELLIAELVGNAVRHARPPLALNVEYDADARVVHLYVSDVSDRLPARRRPGEEHAGGYGLVLLDNLGAEWGSDRTPAGEIVWCRIPVP